MCGFMVSPLVLGTSQGGTHAQPLLLPQQGWSPCVPWGSGAGLPQVGAALSLAWRAPHGLAPSAPGCWGILAQPWSRQPAHGSLDPDLLAVLSQPCQPSTGPADPLLPQQLSFFLHRRDLQGSSSRGAAASAALALLQLGAEGLFLLPPRLTRRLFRSSSPGLPGISRPVA